MKDLLMTAHVFFRTSNVNISRRHLADYVKIFHQKACLKCSTIAFHYSTNQIFELWPIQVAVAVAVLVSLGNFSNNDRDGKKNVT